MVAFIFSLILLIAGIIAGIILIAYKDTYKTYKVHGQEFDSKDEIPYAYKGEILEVVKHTDRPLMKFSAIPFSIGVVLFIVLFIVSITVSVSTGHTGVQTKFGQVQDGVLDAGLHAKAPWVKVTQMDNRVQKETVELSCFSKDIQEVQIKYTINYQIDKDNAQNIYKTIGSDYYTKVIEPTIPEAAKVITAQYTAEELVSARDALASGIEGLLSEQLAKYNIKIVGTAIEDMDFTDVFTDAVEQKQVAAQNKLKAQTEQEQKTMEAQQAAERATIEANAAAAIAKIQAQADMEVAKIGADSAEYQGKREAAVYMRKLGALNGWIVVEIKNPDADSTFKFLDSDGNTISAEEVTKGAKNLIKQGYIDKWDGILPKYILGDDSSILLDLNGD